MIGFILSVVRAVLSIWCIQLGWNWFIVGGDISTFHMSFLSALYVYLFFSFVVGVTDTQSVINDIVSEDDIKHKIVSIIGTLMIILLTWIVQMIIL